MFIVGLLEWWYTTGWVQCALNARDRLAGTYDYFSIDLLARTLFSPWRQISAGKVNGSISVQFRAMIDNLISRVIGSFVRTLTMVIGAISLTIAVLISAVLLLLWPVIPFLPIVGFTLGAVGWVPWSR